MSNFYGHFVHFVQQGYLAVPWTKWTLFPPLVCTPHSSLLFNFFPASRSLKSHVKIQINIKYLLYPKCNKWLIKTFAIRKTKEHGLLDSGRLHHSDDGISGIPPSDNGYLQVQEWRGSEPVYVYYCWLCYSINLCFLYQIR